MADNNNSRIQIFSGEGKYLSSFGVEGSLDSQLSNPCGLSVDSDGNIIVADAGNKLLKIFSPDGKFLMKIGGQGAFTFTFHCIQCDRYLIVGTLSIDNEMARRRRAEVKFSRARVLRMCDVVKTSSTSSSQPSSLRRRLNFSRFSFW